MSDERTETAVEAAAQTFHEINRIKGQFSWGQASAHWKGEVRDMVRPLIIAALAAADAFAAEKAGI